MEGGGSLTQSEEKDFELFEIFEILFYTPLILFWIYGPNSGLFPRIF